jgi:hypothetical protein
MIGVPDVAAGDQIRCRRVQARGFGGPICRGYKSEMVSCGSNDTQDERHRLP